MPPLSKQIIIVFIATNSYAFCLPCGVWGRRFRSKWNAEATCSFHSSDSLRGSTGRSTWGRWRCWLPTTYCRIKKINLSTLNSPRTARSWTGTSSSRATSRNYRIHCRPVWLIWPWRGSVFFSYLGLSQKLPLLSENDGELKKRPSEGQLVLYIQFWNFLPVVKVFTDNWKDIDLVTKDSFGGRQSNCILDL